MVLVGNKTDLAEDRVISEEEGQEYATRLVPACPSCNGLLQYMTSIYKVFLYNTPSCGCDRLVVHVQEQHAVCRNIS